MQRTLFASFTLLAAIATPALAIDLHEVNMDDTDLAQIDLDLEQNYNTQQRMHCWNDANQYLNRDPSRWRSDAVGNPVMKGRWREQGSPYAYAYDNDQAGLCQLLQKDIKQEKGNQVRTPAQLHEMSTRLLDGSPNIAMSNRMEAQRMSAKERLHYGTIKPFVAYAAPVVPAAGPGPGPGPVPDPAPADLTPGQQRWQGLRNRGAKGIISVGKDLTIDELRQQLQDCNTALAAEKAGRAQDRDAQAKAIEDARKEERDRLEEERRQNMALPLDDVNHPCYECFQKLKTGAWNLGASAATAVGDAAQGLASYAGY